MNKEAESFEQTWKRIYETVRLETNCFDVPSTFATRLKAEIEAPLLAYIKIQNGVSEGYSEELSVQTDELSAAQESIKYLEFQSVQLNEHASQGWDNAQKLSDELSAAQERVKELTKSANDWARKAHESHATPFYDELRTENAAIQAKLDAFMLEQYPEEYEDALNTLAKVFHGGEECEGADGWCMSVDEDLWNEGCEAIETLIGGDESEITDSDKLGLDGLGVGGQGGERRREMSRFDEEPDAPLHGECSAEIHRLENENAALKVELAKLQGEQEPLGYVDAEQFKRWDTLRGTTYESPERCYMPFSRTPYQTDMSDCSLPIYTHPAAVPKPEINIDALVNRFLSWKFPEAFYPDGGIYFKPTKPEGYDTGWWPIGTNLLSADQARQMLEHVLAGHSVAIPEGTSKGKLKRLVTQVFREGWHIGRAEFQTFDPSKMQLVPKEPTEEMIRRAFETTRYNEGIGSGADLYRAMIAAAAAENGEKP